jgi:hypothetical protein
MPSEGFFYKGIIGEITLSGESEFDFFMLFYLNSFCESIGINLFKGF